MGRNQIPMTETTIATQTDQKTVSPPPPYPATGTPPYPPTSGTGPALGLERPTGTNVQQPPPYPQASVQAPVEQPFQQQPKHQPAQQYPPTCNYPVSGVMTKPLVSIHNPPIMAQPVPISTIPGATVIVNTRVGHNSFQTQCPNCHTVVYTRTQTEPSHKSFIICLVLCFVGFAVGCCLIPFCIPELDDVDHKCPRCNYQIAEYRA